MKITSNVETNEGRPVSVDLSWEREGTINKLHFPYDVSYKLSDKLKKYLLRSTKLIRFKFMTLTVY